MPNNVLIFIEQHEGRINPASLQLILPARQLAEALGGQVRAVLLGHDLQSLSDVPGQYGIETVYLADDAQLALYCPRPYRAGVCDAIEQSEAQILLLPATAMGRDLAPRIAAKVEGSLATDCLEIALDARSLNAKRPSYCGKCVSNVQLASDRLQIASIRPNAYAEPEKQAAAETTVVQLAPAWTDDAQQTLEIAKTNGGIKDVAEADIIVSGGRSLGSEENFKILYGLAQTLDGAVGASRAAVDAGYQPQSRQVGLTGKIVNPRLYFAFGIDGAIQHLAGMRGSKVIVAINTKPDAPIFSVASYGCVEDLFKIAPLLNEELSKLTAGAAT